MSYTLADLYDDPPFGFKSILPDTRRHCPSPFFFVQGMRGDPFEGYVTLKLEAGQIGYLVKDDIVMHVASGAVFHVTEKRDNRSFYAGCLQVVDQDKFTTQGEWIACGWAWAADEEMPEGYPLREIANRVDISADNPESYDAFMDASPGVRERGHYEPLVGRGLGLRDLTGAEKAEQTKMFEKLLLEGDEAEKRTDFESLEKPLDSSGDVRVSHIGEDTEPGRKARKKRGRIFTYGADGKKLKDSD